MDLVLVGNEVVDEYRMKKGGVILKIFCGKAYDHVDWGFVDEVLAKKGYKYR